MISAPAVRPIQDARGGDARSSDKNRNYVRVVNPAWNGSGLMKRKDAEHYVTTGRAEWLGADQLRLIGSHPANRANAAAAASGYDRAAAVMVRSVDELRHIPILLPRKALTDRSVRGSRHVSGRSGPVRTIVGRS